MVVWRGLAWCVSGDEGRTGRGVAWHGSLLNNVTWSGVALECIVWLDAARSELTSIFEDSLTYTRRFLCSRREMMAVTWHGVGGFALLPGALRCVACMAWRDKVSLACMESSDEAAGE